MQAYIHTQTARLLTFAKIFIMIRFFKIITTLEGISAIVLFFIAMPLKYIYNQPEAVRVTGMAHGVLFTVYIALAILLKFRLHWDWKKFLIICLASIPPFGTFYIEWKYFRNTAN
jgi:integral membrane protein